MSITDNEDQSTLKVFNNTFKDVGFNPTLKRTLMSVLN